MKAEDFITDRAIMTKDRSLAEFVRNNEYHFVDARNPVQKSAMLQNINSTNKNESEVHHYDDDVTYFEDIGDVRDESLSSDDDYSDDESDSHYYNSSNVPKEDDESDLHYAYSILQNDDCSTIKACSYDESTIYVAKPKRRFANRNTAQRCNKNTSGRKIQQQHGQVDDIVEAMKFYEQLYQERHRSIQINDSKSKRKQQHKNVIEKSCNRRLATGVQSNVSATTMSQREFTSLLSQSTQRNHNNSLPTNECNNTLELSESSTKMEQLRSQFLKNKTKVHALIAAEQQLHNEDKVFVHRRSFHEKCHDNEKDNNDNFPKKIDKKNDGRQPAKIPFNNYLKPKTILFSSSSSNATSPFSQRQLVLDFYNSTDLDEQELVLVDRSCHTLTTTNQNCHHRLERAIRAIGTIRRRLICKLGTSSDDSDDDDDYGHTNFHEQIYGKK